MVTELQIKHQPKLKANLDLMTFIDFPSLCFPPSLLINWPASGEMLMERLQYLDLDIKCRKQQYVSQNIQQDGMLGDLSELHTKH